MLKDIGIILTSALPTIGIPLLGMQGQVVLTESNLITLGSAASIIVFVSILVRKFTKLEDAVEQTTKDLNSLKDDFKSLSDKVGEAIKTNNTNNKK